MYVWNGMQICIIVHCVFVLIYMFACNIYVLYIPKRLVLSAVAYHWYVLRYVGIGVDQNNLLWVINQCCGISACL